MTDQMNPGQKLVEFLYSIGLPPMRILTGLITLLVIAAVLAGVYFLNFDSFRSARQPDEDSDTELVENNRTTYEFNLTVDQQIDQLSVSDSTDQNYVVVYGELQDRNERIEKLRQQPGITTEQTGKLDEIKLRNLQRLYVVTLSQGSNADIEKEDFDNFTNKLLNGSNEKSKDMAEFALARIAVIIFARKPTVPNGQTVLDALNQHQSSYVNRIKRATLLLNQLLTCQNRNPDNETAQNCIATIGKILANSTEDDILNLAGQIGEFSLFAGLDIATLENRIRYQERNALADLDNALRVLESHPEVVIEKWQLLMRCYEASLSTGRISNFKTGQSIMSQLVAKLPDSDQRKSKLLGLLTRQKTRVQQFGKPIDLTGDTLNEKQIVQKEGEFTVLCLLDRSDRSVDVMRELGKPQSQLGITYRPIIAFKDKFAKGDMEMARKLPPQLFVATDETGAKYLKSFPTDFFPYLLLIDKDGLVVAGNLSLLQVKNRIAALNKKRSSAAPALDQ